MNSRILNRFALTPPLALQRLHQLRRQGARLLEAPALDERRWARWSERSERFLGCLFDPPMNYRNAFRTDPAGTVSPLDWLEEEPPPAWEVEVRKAERMRQALDRGLAGLASAEERIELIIAEETPP